MSDNNNNNNNENENDQVKNDELSIDDKDKEKKLTYSQIYYRNNKKRQLDYVREKTRCDCGAVIARISWAKHQRSKKHLSNIRHNKFVEDCKNGLYDEKFRKIN